MKREILCPRCLERGWRPKKLAECEDVTGTGTLWLFCRRCGKPVRVDLRGYSVSK